MAKLTAMSFTMHCDREFDKDTMDCCPGGYILNRKQFDFTNSELSYGKDGKTIKCIASGFDKNFFKEAAEENDFAWDPKKGIMKKDVETGTFSEFFIYNGENGDAFYEVIKISDLEFEFDDGVTIRPDEDSELVRSANESLAMGREEEKDLE